MTGHSKNFAAIPIGLRVKFPFFFGATRADFAEQSFLRASFIELALNFIAVHCDVTMALNIGSTIHQ